MKLSFTNPANMQNSAKLSSTAKFKDAWGATQKTNDEGYWIDRTGQPVEHRTLKGETMRVKVDYNGLISNEYIDDSGNKREESTPRNRNSRWNPAR